MSSTYTPSNRFDLQATGDNPSTWGEKLNQRVFAMVDEALDGVNTLDITLTTAYTLTTASGTTDQARKRMLVITGTATADATITVPALNKFYVVKCNYTGDHTVTIKTSGDAGVTFTAGDGGIVYVTASGVFDVLRKSDMLLAGNNLSDLTDVVAARANLGLANPALNTFTNDGTTTVRTLTQDPGTVNALVVVFDGVVQSPNVDYTLSGTTLTYTSTPANGTKEVIFIGNQSLPAGVTSDGSVTTAKLASSAYASQVQAEDGTENTLLMTALRVKQAITAATSSILSSLLSGLILGGVPNNRSINFFDIVIIKYGYDAAPISPGTVVSTTFDSPFPNNCYWASLTSYDLNSTNVVRPMNIQSFSTTGISIGNPTINPGGAGRYWIAIGN